MLYYIEEFFLLRKTTCWLFIYKIFSSMEQGHIIDTLERVHVKLNKKKLFLPKKWAINESIPILNDLAP